MASGTADLAKPKRWGPPFSTTFFERIVYGNDAKLNQKVRPTFILSTGFSGAESGGIQIGDTVVIFAQGPIGLCATAGARLRGAGQIIVVDSVENRLQMSRKLGADVTVNFKDGNPVEAIMRLTESRGVDVAIEALGTQQTFESSLRVLKPGGTLCRAWASTQRDSPFR